MAPKKARNSHYSFVTFATVDEAKAAFDHGAQLKIDGVKLDVVYAKVKKEQQQAVNGAAKKPEQPVKVEPKKAAAAAEPATKKKTGELVAKPKVDTGKKTAPGLLGRSWLKLWVVAATDELTRPITNSDE